LQRNFQKRGNVKYMIICICCSSKYFKEIEKLTEKYKDIKFLIPDLNYQGPLDEKAREKLALKHFKKINQSDFVYLYNPDGQIGNSCAFEIGYALAKGKKIFSFAKIKDKGISGFVKTKSLKSFLNF